MFAHVRTMMRLRAALEPLRRGRTLHLAIHDQVYAFARETGRQSVLVVLNNDTTPQTVRVDVTATRLTDGQTLVDRLALAGDVTVKGGAVEVTLPARAGAVFTTR